MNQILDTGDNKRKKEINIKAIVKIFCILLIIFGICIIVVSVYSLYKSKDENIINKKPEINVEANKEERILKIKVTDDTGISEIEYILNGQEEKIDLNNELEKEIELNLVTGKNTFEIRTTDKNGEIKEYQEQYEVESEVEVSFESENKNININIKSKDKIAYVTYRWNDEEESKAYVDSTEYTFDVKSPNEDGNHILTINVVDENNNTVEKTKEVIVDKEPTIEVTRNDTEFIIHAEDDQKLLKAGISLNGEIIEKINLSGATWDYKVPFTNGENKLVIVVYNLNNIYTIKRVRVINTQE